MQVQENTSEKFAAPALFGEGSLQVGRREQTLGNQDLPELAPPARRFGHGLGDGLFGAERFERSPELEHVLEPLLRVSLQRAHDDARQLARQLGAKFRWPRNGIGDDFRDDRSRCSNERRPSRQKLEEDAAERPDVASRVGRTGGAQLLGGGVVRGPEVFVGRRQALVFAFALRNAEIEHFDDAPLAIAHSADEEVRRFEIAMNDPECMRLGHRACHLLDDVDRFLDRHRTGGFQFRIEVPALEELEHDVR